MHSLKGISSRGYGGWQVQICRVGLKCGLAGGDPREVMVKMKSEGCLLGKMH